MNAQQFKKVIESEIAGSEGEMNLHRQTPRKGLVETPRITVIERLVKNGKTKDQLDEVWLVFVEGPPDWDGYRIVASLGGTEFGLASKAFPKDQHLAMCGWYGDFMSTFRSM